MDGEKCEGGNYTNLPILGSAVSYRSAFVLILILILGRIESGLRSISLHSSWRNILLLSEASLFLA